MIYFNLVCAIYDQNSSLKFNITVTLSIAFIQLLQAMLTTPLCTWTINLLAANRAPIRMFAHPKISTQADVPRIHPEIHRVALAFPSFV
jgi:hypothetical protein